MRPCFHIATALTPCHEDRYIAIAIQKVREERAMSYAVELTGLVKRFGAVTALDAIDLAVRSGSVLGVLGPNGAGKIPPDSGRLTAGSAPPTGGRQTTAVRILATLLRPDAGTALVGGYDVQRDAHRMRQVKTFSGGMRRRIDLAASLVSRPSVLFLDEPTSGLNPVKRSEMWSIIRALVAQGSTVLLTTQYLEEADNLATDIVVFDKGKVVARGTPDELKRRSGSQTLEVQLTDPSRLVEVAGLVAGIVGLDPVRDLPAGRLSVPITDGAMMPAIVRRIDDADIGVTELALRLPSLDDVFLALTGHTTGTPAPAPVDERKAP
jgi:ABC-type multidrug transport system ATPase subunit